MNSLGVSQTLYQGLGNAKDWGSKASKKGVTVNSSPAIGAVAVDTVGQYGHVAFVESVNNNGTITVSQYNKGQDGNYSTQTGAPSSLSFSAFVHLERYETSHISENLPSNQQISTLTKPSQTNTSNGSGNSTSTQTNNSAKPATSSSLSNTSASSTNGSTNSSGTNTYNPPPPPVQPTPPPTPPTFSETVGGNSHTWTNYSNAGGYEGALIPSNTTVQIACKVTGFKVSDGDTWWYRIASSPWSNNYYVSADAFYNNGQISGSLKGTPFVDNAVPNC